MLRKKRIKFLTLLFLLLTTPLSSTIWMDYIVYFEREDFMNGYDNRDLYNRYLFPKKFSDLGYSKDYLVSFVLEKLEKDKPEIYKWIFDCKFNIEQQQVTIEISQKLSKSQFKTVKNELVTSLIFNEFERVIFKLDKKYVVVTLKDINVPYFDLVNYEKNKDKLEESFQCINLTCSVKPLYIFSIVIGVVNVLVLIFLFFKRIKL